MAVKTGTSLLKMKHQDDKITMLTAYDASFAQLLSVEGVDALLVGDSLGMVMQGEQSTVPVTMEAMLYHTRCVSRGNQGSLLLADLPYMSYTHPQQAMDNAARLMQAGAQMVKLEGGGWLIPIVEYLTERGIPVCGHLGLTPQTVHKLGGYKVQGRGDSAAAKLLHEALALQAAGADLLVLECIPANVAKDITQRLTIPVIGIGAGVDCDGQVLVLQDMLGINGDRPYTFVKNFMASSRDGVSGAIRAYIQAVKAKTFPNDTHTFN